MKTRSKSYRRPPPRRPKRKSRKPKRKPNGFGKTIRSTKKAKKQTQKARRARAMRRASKSRFSLRFGAKTTARRLKQDGSLVGKVYSTSLTKGPKDVICNWTHRELIQAAADIKKKRSEVAKKRAARNPWVQKLIRVHKEAKRKGRPIGWARLTKPGERYTGIQKGETALEHAMWGEGKPSKKKAGGGTHMYFDY